MPNTYLQVIGSVCGQGSEKWDSCSKFISSKVPLFMFSTCIEHPQLSDRDSWLEPPPPSHLTVSDWSEIQDTNLLTLSYIEATATDVPLCPWKCSFQPWKSWTTEKPPFLLDTIELWESMVCKVSCYDICIPLRNETCFSWNQNFSL